MKFSFEEALSYIETYTWSSTRLGLERTHELLSLLGDPHKHLKIVHVAGSNGKGSTCSMLASIMQESGYKTGIYISPHIENFCERFRINGTDIPKNRLADVTSKVAELADSMDDHPSQFEIVTAIALQYFYEEKCDIVILEVGMGGSLDSTNVIEPPEVAVITNIGLEHTEYLGNTLSEIASAKAGIIKAGSSCVCYDIEDEALEVVKNICTEKDVPLTVVDFSNITSVSHELSGQIFEYNGSASDLVPSGQFTSSLLGAHQLKNAATVLETVGALRRKGWEISDDTVSKGLANAKWPARFEVLSGLHDSSQKDDVTVSPLFILDGGHNPQCANALAEAIDDYLPDQKITFLIGILKDKDYNAVIDTLMPFAGSFICVTPPTDRAMTAEELCEVLTKKGAVANVAKSASEGITASFDVSNGNPIIAFGSLYLAGDVRLSYTAALKKHLRKKAIAAREALSPEERNQRSHIICERIASSPLYANADSIMIYSSVNAEVDLSHLASKASSDGKTVLYPYCRSKTEMDALLPGNAGAWKKGAFGISEPDPSKSTIFEPSAIDLVVCPCTGFDEACMRLGMGGGYYDRYLPKCENADVVAVAFDCQRIDRVPTDKNDAAVYAVFTEVETYKSL